MKDFAKYMSLGFAIVMILCFFLYVGYCLDRMSECISLGILFSLAYLWYLGSGHGNK